MSSDQFLTAAACFSACKAGITTGLASGVRPGLNERRVPCPADVQHKLCVMMTVTKAVETQRTADQAAGSAGERRCGPNVYDPRELKWRGPAGVAHHSFGWKNEPLQRWSFVPSYHGSSSHGQSHWGSPWIFLGVVASPTVRAVLQ